MLHWKYEERPKLKVRLAHSIRATFAERYIGFPAYSRICHHHSDWVYVSDISFRDMCTAYVPSPSGVDGLAHLGVSYSVFTDRQS